MPSVVRLTRFTLRADSLDKSQAIKTAFDCLREVGIQPLVCDALEPSIWVDPEKKGHALKVLLVHGLLPRDAKV